MRRLLRFAPALGWAALIFWLSSLPHLTDVPYFFDGFDKVVHAGLYAVLTALLLFADRGGRVWLWVLLAALYGGTDEFHQSFVPSRSADPLDLLADAAGAILLAAAYLRVRIYLTQKESRP